MKLKRPRLTNPLSRKNRRPSPEDGEPFDPTKSPLSAFEPFEKQYTRAQMQQMRIIEAAVASYAKRGLAGTSYTTLAEDCEISRPLIHHYFPTLDALFLMTAKFMRAKHLQEVVQQSKSAASGDVQLKDYVTASFNWLEKNPDHAKFWLLYYYQCSLGGQIALEHEELIKAGEHKIDQILQLIETDGKKLSERAKLAKTIQMIIIGGTISAITEAQILTFARARELTLRAVDAALNSKYAP